MDFGDYCLIEQKRHGVENEMYVHKVIGALRSNTYVDVPVQLPRKETIHSSIVDVLSCICCGIEEKIALYYKVEDCKPCDENNYYRRP